IPVALAQNLQTIFVCRFLGGLFASAPLAIVRIIQLISKCGSPSARLPNFRQAGCMLADLFGPVDRGIAVAISATSTFIGPIAGPLVGGFITMSYLGWRWTEYVTANMSFFFGTVGLLVVPETFAPTLPQQRARKIRFRTKNWAIHAKADEHEAELKHICYACLLRPFMILALEPIVALIMLYMGFIYEFLHLYFGAYPIAF
ncbi:hypothetical protein LTR66_013373, partial [Elasticomyces elasticus]